MFFGAPDFAMGGYAIERMVRLYAPEEPGMLPEG
jgi:hypothetical protein